MELVARSVSDFGAGVTLELSREGTDEDAAEVIGSACTEILAGPSYTRLARVLAGEIATLPVPAEVVPTLEGLAKASCWCVRR